MESLHPRVMIIWLLQNLVVAIFFGGITFGADQLLERLPWYAPIIVFVVIYGILIIHTVLRYRIWRFEVREDELYLERGVITRVKTVVPYVRIQHVDSRRGPLERVLNLASTVVYTAGSRGADVLIPGLPPDQSEDLQDDLKALAIESEGEDAV